MRRIAIPLAILGLILTAAAPAAARTPADDAPTATEQQEVANELVLRIQRALSRLGFYTGREHGRLDEATRAAIRFYQQTQGLPVDGRATRPLADELDYAVDVRQLLKRLDVTRRSGRSAAREKLLAHPETRDLVAPERKSEVADPTRDASPCFREPTVLCLVTEARETAKAVFKPELRDWALGDILIAEARAGLGERAMDTASRIKDPRLIVVALRDIAEATAAGGDAEAALQAASIIPDAEKRAEALIAIGAIQLHRGDAGDAETSFARLADTVAALADPVRRIEFRCREAAVRFEAGDVEFAREMLTTAETDAAALDGDVRLNALRHVASAHAAIARSDAALETLDSLGPAGGEMPVLMTAVRSLTAAGQLVPARAAANRISEPRYRAVALGRLALAHVETGDVAAAGDTLAAANGEVARIEKPFAQDFARSRLALVHLRLAAVLDDTAARNAHADDAAELAGGIADARLKAQTLWQIATGRQRLGDPEGAAATEARAREATQEIVGDVSRVWMFAELALGESPAHPNAARAFFDRGIATAEGIKNAWARARALAKLSTTLLSLVAPGSGRDADGLPRTP